MNGPVPLSEFEQEIVGIVRQHGCMVMNVFDPEQQEPDFSYSIGFPETAGQAEVIVFTLPKSLRANMINEILRQMTEEGLKLEDGARIGGLIEGFECVARRITSREALDEHFGSAIWYHRSQREIEIVDAFQIVWPGARQGLFPWEDGCVQDVIDDQPALYQTSIH
ncbi:DUF4262 domain-containing protein [Novosphingobium sp.]|uniref:DUF4262 domain-containing protein n=1 Tax=Novosphingobium sp. TaxID=1874826 RepID=UPI002FE0AE3B